MRTVGKALQLVGLILLPIVCYAQLTGGLGRSLHVSEMVLYSAFGAGSFVLGRYIEGYGAKI